MQASKTFTGENESGDRIVASMESVPGIRRDVLNLQLFEKYDESYAEFWSTNRRYDNLSGSDSTSTAYQIKQYIGDYELP